MAAEVLKEIGLLPERDMIEQDSVKDINIFMGDMNFRINKTFSEFAPHVQNAPFFVDTLDQLKEAMTEHGYFPGYVEPRIRFMPTYKRAKDQHQFINKNEQCPSYTDRILFKNNSNCQFKINNYYCLENYFGSDHRPVYMTMSLKTAPNNYMDLSKLVDERVEDQGRGELQAQFVMLSIDEHKLAKITEQLPDPSYF